MREGIFCEILIIYNHCSHLKKLSLTEVTYNVLWPVQHQGVGGNLQIVVHDIKSLRIVIATTNITGMEFKEMHFVAKQFTF